MWKLLGILSLFVAGFAGSHACFAAGEEDNPGKSIALCSSIKGSLERLQCFDDLAARLHLNGPQKEVPTQTTDTGKWLVNRTKNPIDDTETVNITLFSDSGRSQFGQPIGLFIRCQSKTTALFLNWSSFLGGDTSQVLTRIGDSSAVQSSWTSSTDKEASFLEGSPAIVIAFIRDMAKANSFVAQVTPYEESPITAVFDTRGLTQALKPVSEVCNWPS